MSVGALSHFGFAPATLAAPEGLVTISKFFDPTSADIKDTYPLEAIPTMNQNRAQRRSRRNIREVGGDFSTPGYFDVLPWFFLFGLGACASSAGPVAQTYEHTFSPIVGSLPTFCAEVGYYNVGGIQSYGNKLDKLTFGAKPGEELTVGGEFIGVGTHNNAAATASDLPGDDCIAQFAGATVLFDGVQDTDIMSLDLSVENGLERIATLNNTMFVQRIREKIRALSLSLEMDFIHQDHYDRAMAAAWLEIELNFVSENEIGTGVNYEMNIKLPKVGFSTVETPVSADGIISQKIECQPLYDPIALTDIEIVVINKEASYPIPA